MLGIYALNAEMPFVRLNGKSERREDQRRSCIGIAELRYAISYGKSQFRKVEV
jgi:hypothetical protein